MSEKDTVDEAADSRTNSDSINRRRFVKSLGVAGSASVFGSLGIHSASAEGISNGIRAQKSGQDIDVQQLHRIDENTASSYAESATSWTRSKSEQSADSTMQGSVLSLADGLMTKEHLSAEFEVTNGYEITTDDAELNDVNPVLLMTPATSPDSKRKESGKVGLLSTVVADDREGKVPIASMAFTAGSTNYASDSSAGASNDDGITMRIYGVNDDGPTEIGRYTSPSVITPQASIGCTTCSVIVNSLCGGFYGPIGYEACLDICIPAATGIVTYPACVSACGLIVAALTEYGCTDYSIDFCNYHNLC